MHTRPTLLAILLFASAPAAQLVSNPTPIPSGSPFNNSVSENVDFGDVDLDGDWDAVFADGGDPGNDQNRIWINFGGLQAGSLGTFVDETASRYPVLVDQSRDIEMADLDNDGDLDIWHSNDSQISSQGGRILINLGGDQGSTLGFFADQTKARWPGLGASGSSVSPALVLPSGNFIDWTEDDDFGDLDNDGDLDLIHTSRAGAYAGTVPTRIFLNDGSGVFTEFNPSGFQVVGANITDGDPGIWCEGIQQDETADTTGAFCDVATAAMDADVGDIDGDFDLDILLGDRNQEPRMFANRLEGSSLAPGLGSLGFRDVTAAVFPPVYAPGQGHYDQEFGDMDGDGDLDILGVDWWNTTDPFTYTDLTLENDGTGVFGNLTLMPNSGLDDNEGDFVDYDGDGDLDVYIASWSGKDRLMRNDTSGSGIVYAFDQEAVQSNGINWDADAADLDGDGDYDTMVARDGFQPNLFMENQFDVPDTAAPSIPQVEATADVLASGTVLPVRAHVLDNAPYYVTYAADVDLRVQVDGIELPAFPMKSSGGQVFRGELRGNLVGAITYHVEATDAQGNTGASASQGYASVGSFGFTFGVGTGSTTIQSLSQVHEGLPAYLVGRGAGPGQTGFMALSLTQQVPPLATGIPGLTLNVGVPYLLLEVGITDANGDLVVVTPAPPVGSAGVPIFAQFAATDGVVIDASKGMGLTILP